MNFIKTVFVVSTITLLVACSGGGSSRSTPAVAVTPAPAAPDPITVSGSIQDGPVTGGSLYFFSADQIVAAIAAADSATDRAAALSAQAPIATLVRVASDGSSFSLELPGTTANGAIFIVFDGVGAEDEGFGDQPFDMESVVVLGAAGTTARANISPHTSLLTIQVRDGLADISAAAIQASIDLATNQVIAAGGSDEFGNELIPAGTNIVSTTDEALLETASSYLGRLIRTAAAMFDLPRSQVLRALAADSADGALDGNVPASFSDATNTDVATTISSVVTAGRINIETGGGSCATVARLLGKACEFDVLDDFLEAKGICLDTSDDETFTDCMTDVRADQAENSEQCGDVLEARQEVCESLDDAVHDPSFGPAFAANFVDPKDIGDTVVANPYFPLVTGNIWVYSGTFDDDEGEEVTETITVTVTNKTKLIEGVTCVVVIDIAEEDGVVIENTDDWFAQDVDGNVWYCGEISENFELVDGDDPELPELEDIEGSWKSGREGAQAGIALPFAPQVGSTIRQEVLYGEAEDVIDIESLTGTETSQGGACAGNCLVTRDYTPLEPDVEENKYYVPGLGLIVEIDLETGNRVELISFTAGG